MPTPRQPARWSDTCAKAPWQPPDAVFGVAWTALYTLYGVSLWREQHNPETRDPLLVGLAMNAAWVPLFSATPRGALVLLTAMVAVAVFCTRRLAVEDAAATPPRTRLQSRAVQFAPYLGWLAFAWTLNAYVVLKCPPPGGSRGPAEDVVVNRKADAGFLI